MAVTTAEDGHLVKVIHLREHAAHYNSEAEVRLVVHELVVALVRELQCDAERLAGRAMDRAMRGWPRKGLWQSSSAPMPDELLCMSMATASCITGRLHVCTLQAGLLARLPCSS